MDRRRAFDDDIGVEVRAESQLAGRTLANRYDVLDLIGAGGMGAVYRVRDRELDELVALKVIRSELADNPAIVERFRHEVKLARRVTHTNVARTFELGHADGLMFCTMELVDGESLTRRLRHQRRLPVAEAVAIACAVCDALTAAHAVDVIHRDIKPDNVLIARTGRIVLADFGIASIGVDGGGDLSGTPAYMAPEQARGAPPTPATDVYAVGVLLYEMLTGTRAFSGDGMQILADKQAFEHLVIPSALGIDPALTDVIAAATTTDVARRILSAAAVRARLAAWAPRTKFAIEPLVTTTAADATELHTVIVFAPRADRDDSRLYLADAVFEELLRRLTLRPRLRVLPRVNETPEPGATMVALHASDVLRITVSAGEHGDSVTLRLPLAVDKVGDVAEAAANAIANSAMFDHTPNQDPATEALDLLLHARYIGNRDVAVISGAIERLDRANALLPGDPRIAANLAIMQVRQAFFDPEVSGELLARSTALVRIALASGPKLAESHLAAGHLELNIGEASVAAGHYRVAIACAPHLAESHESLGRMLLEAGFLDRAFARLDEALAIAPSHHAIRWDIARAHALEQRWTDHDQVLEELRVRRFSRPLRSVPLRMRFAMWRRDLRTLAAIRDEAAVGFDLVLLRSTLAVYLDGGWSAERDVLIERAFDQSSSVRRRRAFVAQLVAEAAGFAGDTETCLAMIAHAVSNGLFDLHWLDRCPLLDVTRATAELARQRAIVKARADAILDALYGDHAVHGLSETVAASVP